MNEIDVNSVLSQIRALSAQASGGSTAANANAGATAVSPGGFSQMVGQALDKVNAAQSNAESLQKSFELGDPSTDLASVMIAQAHAQVSFSALNQVRNRLVSAYQDIMNMQI